MHSDQHHKLRNSHSACKSPLLKVSLQYFGGALNYKHCRWGFRCKSSNIKIPKVVEVVAYFPIPIGFQRSVGRHNDLVESIKGLERRDVIDPNHARDV